MLLSSLFIPLLTSTFAVYAAPFESGDQDAYGPYHLVERIIAPRGWTYKGSAESDSTLNLKLVIKSGHGQNLERKLLEISTPGNPKYGKHLSQKELAEITSPNDETVRLITSWLSSYKGVGKMVYSAETSSIAFDTTVEVGNHMLQAQFSTFEASSGSVIRSLEYSLPAHLAEQISFIHPVTYFPKSTLQKTEDSSELKIGNARESVANIVPRAVDPDLLAACQKILPECIAKLYKINYSPPDNATSSGSRIGIAGFLEQWVNHADITAFVLKHGNSPSMRANPGNFTVELINGGINNESAPTVEATLDFEYTMAFTGSLPAVYYSTGGRPPALNALGHNKTLNHNNNEPYLEFLQHLLAKPDGAIPQVISISYTDTEQGVPRDYAVHVCDLFGRLAARGVSIINASGDGGIAGQTDFECVSNDGQNRTMWLPTFPASCPWVTAVGGTKLLPEQTYTSSSGGFSNYFAAPGYQQKSTKTFIASMNGQYKGQYNASGRGIPDVAFWASRYEIEDANGGGGHFTGTSASAPVFAAMISLVNDVRLRNGKPALGWLNPALYSKSLSGIWNDITEGQSYGCGAVLNATVGWDAITGLGSADFPRLLKALS